MRKPKLVIISGPTGSGKSALAIEAAPRLGGEIINADSLAFYKGFDIGAAKPGPDDLARVPHHLFDILEPDEHFDAARYLRLARPAIEDLYARGRAPLAVGGTGFYLRSLIAGLFEGPGRDEEFRNALAGLSAPLLHARLAEVDPATAARLALNDRVRIERALEVLHVSGESISAWQARHRLADRPFDVLNLVVDRPDLKARLALRTEAMFEAGLVAEVEGLLARGLSEDLKPLKSIGYKECVDYLKGRADLAETKAKIFSATVKLAKRQRTWFRGQMPDALYFHPDALDEICKVITAFLKHKM